MTLMAAMIKEDLPSWMDGVNASLADDVCVWEGKAPNHWLVNEYEAGQVWWELIGGWG